MPSRGATTRWCKRPSWSQAVSSLQSIWRWTCSRVSSTLACVEATRMRLLDMLGLGRAPKSTYHAGTVLAAGIFLVVALAALLAPLLAPHDPVEQFRQHLLQAPSWSGQGSSQFWL